MSGVDEGMCGEEGCYDSRICIRGIVIAAREGALEGWHFMV